MADKKISELVEADPLDGTEDLPIVKDGSTVRCSTQDIANLKGDSEPLIYAAKVTQSGTSNPTATVASNTTGKTIAWTRASGGYSLATANAACFTTGKTIVLVNGIGAGGTGDPKIFSNSVASTTVVSFGSFRASDQTAEDDWSMDVLILIYP